jgi:hypothetical protein
LIEFSHISEHGCTREKDRPHFSIYSPSATTQDANPDEPPESTEPANEGQGPDLPSPAPKPGEEEADPTLNTNDETTRESNDKKQETKAAEKPTDPLKWFGILVPPALRTAQSTFVGAVEGPIPQLATIVRDLRTQEIEIGRLRKQMKKM